MVDRTRAATIDWFIFIASAVAIIGVCLPLATAPEAGGAFLNQAFEFVTVRFGVLYILFAVFAFIFLLFLAVSKYGSIRLGGDGRPEYGEFSWSAMLFCGGIGTSVLYWGTIEWAHYYAAPPFGVQPESIEALHWSTAYPVFHWGLLGWALYCLPGVASAYAYHVRGIHSLRLSSACAAVLGDRVNGWLGRVIDVVYMVGLIGATSTGIGLAVPLIAATLGQMFGLEPSFLLNVLVIAGVTAVFSASVWVGLDRGIKPLSRAAVWLAFALLVYVFAVGPTRFIVELSTSTSGYLLENFIRMSTWTDPLQNASFVESWTVFYWAWWLALGPFMGIFITKISAGRTIKQVVFGALGWGTLGCTVFFFVLGGYAVHLQNAGLVDLNAAVNAGQEASAVVSVFASLPLANLVLPVFCTVCVIFAATSYDSASYTLASSTTRELVADAHPARWNRVFWALTLGLLPITLIYIGGLRPLQSAVVAVSLPLLGVVILMTFSLWRSLQEDTQAIVQQAS